ncbi:hypothetical protein DPMN_051881 [Dreissena polymorpha]|uniref:Uncharacterized protein n=1 Tax=Dreissena polymorpha TaxID=45954 RepID=A0A9D4HPA8_DREPO|nr:hypothetical protein DPMN_051881 [Dreissena polymorpha]
MEKEKTRKEAAYPFCEVVDPKKTPPLGLYDPRMLELMREDPTLVCMIHPCCNSGEKFRRIPPLPCIALYILMSCY